MPGQRPSPKLPAGEQLVFPFQLRVGDVVLDDGARLVVAGPPTGFRGGRVTRVLVRRDGDMSARTTVLDSWRKVRVVRTMAA